MGKPVKKRVACVFIGGLAKPRLRCSRVWPDRVDEDRVPKLDTARQPDRGSSAMENHPLGCQTEDVSASVFKSNAPGEQVELAPRVLIVEDEMFVGLQYEDALTEAGINVVEI